MNRITTFARWIEASFYNEIGDGLWPVAVFGTAVSVLCAVLAFCIA